MQRPLLQLVILLALGALITLPNLSGAGLTSSEGHRVIPAIEMVESGDWLVPTMFGQPYVRKPQGVPWLFAVALSIHNDPDLSPRLVSALAFVLMSIGSWWFARRWFGSSAGLPAGLAVLLMPLFWSPARAAEIESIHNLTTALGAWITIELLIHTGKTRIRWSVALGIAALSMLITKGPAGFPIFLGLIVADSILKRSSRPLFKPTILIPIALAALAFAWHWHRTLLAAGPDAITQSPNAFMFEPDRLLKLAGFIPVSLITALPIVLALLFPWGADAKREASESDPLRSRLHSARLIALSIPIALLIMMLTGVSNDRYAQPILATMPPIIGWILTTPLAPHRSKILRIMTLGSPKLLAALLVVGAAINITLIEPTQRSTSGKAPGIQLAQDYLQTDPPPHAVLLADAMIEARPETLLYFQKALQSTGCQLDIHWIPKLTPERLANLTSSDQVPEVPLLALIRTDPAGDESDKLLVQRVIATGHVHEFEFTLVKLSDH